MRRKGGEGEKKGKNCRERGKVEREGREGGRERKKGSREGGRRIGETREFFICIKSRGQNKRRQRQRKRIKPRATLDKTRTQTRTIGRVDPQAELHSSHILLELVVRVLLHQIASLPTGVERVMHAASQCATCWLGEDRRGLTPQHHLQYAE